jgi:SulP family sulfate permease
MLDRVHLGRGNAGIIHAESFPEALRIAASIVKTTNPAPATLN